MYELESDPQLARRYYDCDERAFTVLKTRHQDRQCRRAASTWLSQYPDRASEVVEDCWIKFGLTKVQGSRYDPTRPFTPYVDRILYHACMDFHRESDPRVESLDLDDNLEDDLHTDPQRLSELAQAVQRLEECAGELNPQERLLYDRVLVMGEKYEEAALSTGMPMGTIAATIHRIRRKLVECLRRKGQSVII